MTTARIITREQRLARALNSSPNTTPAAPANQVGWHKKGCTTCGPKIFPTRKV